MGTADHLTLLRLLITAIVCDQVKGKQEASKLRVYTEEGRIHGYPSCVRVGRSHF